MNNEMERVQQALASSDDKAALAEFARLEAKYGWTAAAAFWDKACKLFDERAADPNPVHATPAAEAETETYIELQMDGFNKLVLRHQDTLRTALEIMTGADWDSADPIQLTIAPVEMTPKDFEELPEWEG